MYELALFPLFTVLFPGMPLHLRIFEPRYRLMIKRCLDANQPFGVVLIRKGEEARDPWPSLISPAVRRASPVLNGKGMAR